MKPISGRDVVSRAAYLLFYQRRQITNDSRAALQDGTHWIYTLYERPTVVETYTADRKDDKTFVGDDRNRTDKYENSVKDQRNTIVNEKSKGGERGFYSEREHVYSELHREINSPRQTVEDYSSSINSPRQDISSQRRDQNSPVKEVKNERHTSDDLSKTESLQYEQLRVKLDKSKPSVKQDVENSQEGSDKYYVDRVKLPSSEVSRNNPQTYRRSFSEDSNRNAINSSYTSNSDASNRSNPPSLVTDGSLKSNPPSPNTPDSVGSYEKKALLNNERNVNTQSGISNDVKVKFYQNELEKENVTLKTGKSELLERPNIPVMQYNQTKSNNKSKPDLNIAQTVRADVFATPQQNRKSPSPPVQNGRGPWLTPQPQRKYQHNLETRTHMERQSSVSDKTHQASSYFEHQFERHRQAELDSQPHSLPIEINYTSEKPPLPRQGTSQRVLPRPKSQEHTSQSYDSSDREKLVEAVLRSRVDSESKTREEKWIYENEAIRKQVSNMEKAERARSVERDRGKGNVLSREEVIHF